MALVKSGSYGTAAKISSSKRELVAAIAFFIGTFINERNLIAGRIVNGANVRLFRKQTLKVIMASFHLQKGLFTDFPLCKT